MFGGVKRLVLSTSQQHLRRKNMFVSVRMPEVISIAWLQFRLHTALDVFLNFLMVPLLEQFVDIEIHLFFAPQLFFVDVR